MKCPICGKEVELQKKQVTVAPNGDPVFHEYAVCRDCKKQWDLDKQRAKKRAAEVHSTAPQATKPSNVKPVPKAETPVKKAAPKAEATAKKSASPLTQNTTKVDTDGGQYYGNIPPEHIRVKRERAVRQSYEEMLATDPNYKPRKKKTTTEESDAPKKRPEPEKKRPEPEKERPVTKPEYEDDSDYDEDDEYIYYIPAKYRVVRIILGILSILGFGYFAYRGFLAGLDSIASGGQTSSGMTYIILAVCMLVSGLLLLILQNKRSVAAYIAPVVFYIAGAVFAFLKRDGDSILLYSAIASAVLALILIILCATSRNQEDEEEYEDDDEFDDDEYDEFDDDEFDDED